MILFNKLFKKNSRFIPVFLSVVFLFGILSLTACIPLLVGTGVVAGYTLSNDSATGEVKCEYRTLWDISNDNLENMHAEIISSNESKGLIKAKVSDNEVVIKIDTINSQMQRLKVSARKYLMPKPQFAQKIFVKIVQNLE